MADLLIDQMLDVDEEDYNLDEDEGPFPRFPWRITCRYCGREGLAWEHRAGLGWRLVDRRGLHHYTYFHPTKRKTMNTSPRTFFIAGVQHRPDWRKTADGVERDLTRSQEIEVKLIGEPSNAFDRYAVKVMFGNVHVGYVPKPVNVDFWALHAAGYKPTAKLLDFHPNLDPWKMYQISVSFTKP